MRCHLNLLTERFVELKEISSKLCETHMSGSSPVRFAPQIMMLRSLGKVAQELGKEPLRVLVSNNGQALKCSNSAQLA